MIFSTYNFDMSSQRCADWGLFPRHSIVVLFGRSKRAIGDRSNSFRWWRSANANLMTAPCPSTNFERLSHRSITNNDGTNEVIYRLPYCSHMHGYALYECVNRLVAVERSQFRWNAEKCGRRRWITIIAIRRKMRSVHTWTVSLWPYGDAVCLRLCLLHLTDFNLEQYSNRMRPPHTRRRRTFILGVVNGKCVQLFTLILWISVEWCRDARARCSAYFFFNSNKTDYAQHAHHPRATTIWHMRPL